MKERPILFSAPMVRAILDGRKTQTRRIAKKMVRHPDLGNLYTPGALVLEHEPRHVIERACPYGQPGDRLWVREAWRTVAGADGIPPRDLMNVESFTTFEADCQKPSGMGKLRPSMFMPRWASRIDLEITAVRVERLQDISEVDALAEGIACENIVVSTYYANGHHEVTEDRFFFDGCVEDGFDSAADAYAALWESINGAGAWSANPWVWVVEFRRIGQ